MWRYKTDRSISTLSSAGMLFKICGAGNVPVILSDTSFGVPQKLSDEQESQLLLCCNFEKDEIN